MLTKQKRINKLLNYVTTTSKIQTACQQFISAKISFDVLFASLSIVDLQISRTEFYSVADGMTGIGWCSDQDPEFYQAGIKIKKEIENIQKIKHIFKSKFETYHQKYKDFLDLKQQEFISNKIGYLGVSPIHYDMSIKAAY